ncbi:DUF6665 family protein [Sphingomonas olei]
MNQAFQHEIAAEKAASLARSGKKLAATLAQLRAAPDGSDRAMLIRNVAEAAHHYFIQRELCGLFVHQSIIDDHDTPREVLAQMGAR